jgi:hypothetical protein
MGQGTMTGISGPSRSTSIRGMTSVDERDEQVLKHRLLDGMQGVRGSNPLSSTTTSAQVSASVTRWPVLLRAAFHAVGPRLGHKARRGTRAYEDGGIACRTYVEW